NGKGPRPPEGNAPDKESAPRSRRVPTARLRAAHSAIACLALVGELPHAPETHTHSSNVHGAPFGVAAQAAALESCRHDPSLRPLPQTLLQKVRCWNSRRFAIAAAAGIRTTHPSRYSEKSAGVRIAPR